MGASHFMFSINSFSVNRLNNAEFVGLMINLSNLIERSEASKLGLDQTLVTNFDAKKQQLIDQVRVSAASELTVEMNAAHEKRIRQFKLVNYTLRKVEVAPKGSSILQFADRVSTLILKPYPLSITRLPQQELTTVLSGLIYDMRHKFTEDDLDDLGVATELTNLESANQEFIAAYANRVAQRAEAGSALTQQLRLEMVDLYMSICFTSQYYANSELEANASKAKTCQEFITNANLMIADAKSRYQQRINKNQSDTQSGDTNTPGGPTPDPSLPEGSGNQGGDNTSGSGTQGGGNTSGSGTNTDGGNGGNTQGGNNEPVIDHENGTEHDGTLEF